MVISIFLQIGTNIPELLESVKQPQPFVLLMGERSMPEQTFVVVDRRTVKCQSLVRAVDMTFKLFYLLDLEYPWECHNTWDFIQKFIFGLGEGKGRSTSASSVTLFCNYLRRT